MDLSILEGVLGLGVGGVGMIVIFLMYRQDRRASEKRLTQLLEQSQETLKENTQAITELTTLVKRLNGHT